MNSFIQTKQLIILILISLIIIIVYYFQLNYQKNVIDYNIPDPDCTGIFNLCTDTDKERLGRQAIRIIHEQIDDDKDGSIEITESSDFIQQILETKTNSIRHKQFQNINLHITFDDLWKQWINNPVYNWTTNDVIDWLINSVQLPQYVDNFRRNQFDGRMIPRLAANDRQYITMIMHIRDIRDKQRLIIKSTDIILFGPPEQIHHLLKYVILISSLLISIIGCIYALFRQCQIQEDMNIILKEFEILQQAEINLLPTSGKMKIQEKMHVGKRLIHRWICDIQQTKNEANRFHKHRDAVIDHEKQLTLALQEIEQLQIAIQQAEEHARQQSSEPPNELIDLLKRTYQIEEIAFEIKRKLAETALITAKEHMYKISKIQKGFFGAVRIAHTNCMEDVGELINTAKEQLIKVHIEYEEREQRWNKIALLLNRDDLIGSSKILQT